MSFLKSAFKFSSPAKSEAYLESKSSSEKSVTCFSKNSSIPFLYKSVSLNWKLTSSSFPSNH